jgi:pilus assembly protein Flp/PilA
MHWSMSAIGVHGRRAPDQGDPATLRLHTYIAWRVAALWERLRHERAQGMVEYGLILVLVAIAVVIALSSVGGQLKTVFNTIKNGLLT